MYNEKLLKSDEKAVFAFRQLYKQYGYLPFKMSKFEEYDLYVRNKDFLVGDSVITFTDTNGKLLALKPDVTLSIIKNTSDKEGQKQKVYYNENVYRVSGSTHQFKEIMQAGLECIGDIDVLDVFEVVYLAVKSLQTVSSDFILDISHMGLYSAILEEVSTDEYFKSELTGLLCEKNRHEALALCKNCSLSKEKTECIEALFSLYGDITTVLTRLDELCKTAEQKNALAELKTLCDLLLKTEFADRIKLDFSLANDMQYYDGIVFKGFINGIFEDVLAGGRYDPLMRRMGRKSSAVGFAIYVDLLGELDTKSEQYDIDVLLIYDKKSKAETVISMKEKLVEQGKTVYAAKAVPDKLRYREIVDLSMEDTL